jgi:molybdate transport system substrate-binding protein
VSSRSPTFAAVAVMALGAGACGGSPATSAAGGQHAATPAALSGNLTVFAASSLTEAFDDARATLEAAGSGLSITYSFAGSQALVSQVENGAPADVIATADSATMQKLVGAGLVDAPRTFARNKLEIVVAPGNPKHVTGLADLARKDLKVILEDPSVPAGRYARQALRAQNVTAAPISQPLDVKSELLAVEQGNADVGIVYVTDVASAAGAVAGVPIPESENVIATYPMAVVKASSHAGVASAFVDSMISGTGQRALRARGFLAP